MTNGIPLQKKEDQNLEFKSRDALKDLDKIVREVVGMLNADGGEVWIGLRDVNDIAVEVEAIPDANLAERCLRDKLVDSVEPSPTHEEVSVDVVSDVSAEQVLRIVVQPVRERKPYAHVRRQRRYYGIRVGDRLRVMRHSEIEGAFRDRSPTENVENQEHKDLIDRFYELRETRLRLGDPGLWIGVQPLSSLKVPIEDDYVRDLFMHPERTQNRAAGWTFVNPFQEPTLDVDQISGGNRYASVEIRDDGATLCNVDLDALRWKGGSVVKTYALMEYPTSVFRLASALISQYRGVGVFNEDRVLADLALFGVAEMELYSGSPQRWEMGIVLDHEVGECKDGYIFGREPLAFTIGDVIEHPDRCAYRLYRRIFQGFGHRESAIPDAYDRKTFTLVFPD